MPTLLLFGIRYSDSKRRGTSTNGAGAFGASLNILTDGISNEAGGQVSIGAGSFNTQRYNAIFSTGLLSNKFAFEANYLRSSGYIDRASLILPHGMLPEVIMVKTQQ